MSGTGKPNNYSLATSIQQRTSVLKSSPSGDTFEATAKHWYDSKSELRSKPWREGHSLYLRRDLNPNIGNVPLEQIDARALLNVLEAVRRERGIKTAEPVRQTAVQVFDHARRKLKVEALDISGRSEGEK